MENQTVKQNFIDDLPVDARSALADIDHAIIDEIVENILDGGATLNDKKPVTREEYFLLIASSFTIAKSTLTGMLKGFSERYPDATVNLNYRGLKLKHNNPAMS